jgi:hypothetical protein
MKRLLAIVLIIFFAGLGVAGLLSTISQPALGQGASTRNPTCSEIGQLTTCSPAQLGANALTEPALSTSALTNIIDTRNARQAVLKSSCTQGNITINVQTYAEDGTSTLALVSPVSALAASTQNDLSISSETNPATISGTLSGTALIRFPQRALAFSWTNASATPGTCTARLFLAY